MIYLITDMVEVLIATLVCLLMIQKYYGEDEVEDCQKLQENIEKFM